MRFLRLTLCLALAAAPALAQPAQTSPPPLLCGDDQALWLVRPGADGNSFDVLFRPAGEKWQTLVIGLTGKPGTVACLDGTLHVIFTDPLAHGMFQMNSPAMVPLEKPSDPRWPPDALPLALCAAEKFGDVTKPCLIAIVARNVPLPSTAPTYNIPAPASRMSASSAAPLVWLEPFLFADGKWQPLSAKPPADSLTSTGLARNDRVMIAVAGGSLYRLISTPGREANALTVWDKFSPEKVDCPFFWRPVPTEKELAGSKPVAMFTLVDKLAIVAAVPVDKEKIQLKLFIMEEPGRFSQCAITLGQAPYAWDASSPPLVAGMGELQFEMVWRRDAKLMDSRCALDVRMKKPEELPADNREADAQARQAYNYFLAGVFVVILVLLALRRQMLPRPLELPPRTVPGNLLKRGAAALLDMMPWLGVSALVFGLTSEEIPPPFGDLPPLTNSLIYWQILGLSLYVVYCTLMEAFLGATAGKLIFRLRVVDDQGRRPNLPSAALRNLMKVMELLHIPLVGPLPLLLLFPIFSPYRLRIGDIMARTFVIESRLLPPEPANPPPK